jgi:WD40 repeat protein
MAKRKPEEKSSRTDDEDVAGLKLLRTFEGHRSWVISVAFDPQGDTLATGSNDHTVKLWDPHSGRLLRTLEGHQKAVYSVAFDAQGGMLASGSDDRTVKLWQADNGKLLRTLVGHQDSVRSVAFQPHGRTLASASDDNSLRIWDVQSGKLLRTLEGHQSFVIGVAFDSSGDSLVSGSLDSTLKRWDVQSGQLLATIEGRHKVLSVTLAPGGETLASGGSDSTLKLWEVQSGKLIRTLEGHTETVDAVAFSPDGRLLATTDRYHSTRLWNCETWETVAVIPKLGVERWATALAFHPTKPLLATLGSTTGDDLQSIRLWELDVDLLLSRGARKAEDARAIHHTTGKIVLVGDHSVGKSALGLSLDPRPF